MISFIVMIVWWIGKFWEQLISQINLCLGCLERTFTSFLTQDKLVRRVKAILETSPPIKTTIIRSDDQSSWLMIRLRLKSMSTLVAAASSYTLFTLAIVSVIDGDIFRRSEQWWCHFLLSLSLPESQENERNRNMTKGHWNKCKRVGLQTMIWLMKCLRRSSHSLDTSWE